MIPPIAEKILNLLSGLTRAEIEDTLYGVNRQVHAYFQRDKFLPEEEEVQKMVFSEVEYRKQQEEIGKALNLSPCCVGQENDGKD